ncbi:hypothetical protein THRCLA_21769 [Thraustotheca clavata]|uniref:Cyclic nucleotide-binding domain-containing protein n=1 Tax=Thraustotheca clavata TaxID=74557 RepID=A0A1V9ZPT7_9STRA|nr:hypothetical protein THRCLA_21769 [Thraustotheca clavata]
MESTLNPVLPQLASKRRVSNKNIASKRRDSEHRHSFQHKVPRRPELEKIDAQLDELEMLKQALMEDPNTRSDADILFLNITFSFSLTIFTSHTKIFASSHEYVCREICRHMRLIKLPSRAILIRQSDTGDRCYIIIDGTVDVYIRKEDTFLGASEDIETQYRLATSTLNFGTFMTTLKPGSIVGEVVLTNPSARRTATVVVSEETPECCVIFLGRADYIRLIRNVSMEASHFAQAEILDFMVLFQKWSKPDKMKFVSQMKSMHFRINDYLYKAGTVTKVMYIIVLGEAMEKYNLNVTQTHGSIPPTSTATKSEIKVNIELMLLGPGDIANEYAFFRPSMMGHFDIKAVTEVFALAIDKHLYEATVGGSNPIESALDMQAKLISMSNDRDEWRKERIEFGSRYPDAHIAMTWNLLRMGNLRCSRCGKRGHLPMDLGRCHHSKKTEWLAVLQRIDHQLCPTPAKSTVPARFDSPRVRRSILTNAKELHLLDESSLPTAKEQLELSWRLRQLAFPSCSPPKSVEQSSSS